MRVVACVFVVLVTTTLVIASTSGAAFAATTNAIGLVTDLGGLNDRSFNALANTGIERAEGSLGVTSSVLESRSSADYRTNLDQLAQNHDLVFGIGFLMGDDLKAAAAAAPATKFAILDFTYADGPPPAVWNATSNVTGVVFNERQAGYLAGALAGSVERNGGVRTNRARTVSAVGGQNIPPVMNYIRGFRDGVHRTCPGCRVLIGLSQDFIDQAKCRNLARAQIRRGSDIVFVVAGGCGLGALDEVRARGVWGVGVDADQSYLGPHILTSAVKRVDVAVYDLIRRNQAGDFPGGRSAVYGVARNAVGIGRIATPARRHRFAVDAALRDIRSGAVR